MKLIGNIIWLLFGGLFLSISYLFAGLFLCITIIGIPFGIQVFKLSGLALWPFGKEVRYKKQTTGCLNTGMNLLWILIGGLWLALAHAITGLIYCITIIGIPFGKQHFKLASIILTPFGREVVSSSRVRQDAAAAAAATESTTPVEIVSAVKETPAHPAEETIPGEESVAAEDSPAVETPPVAEEALVAEKPHVVEEAPIVEENLVVEETPAVEKLLDEAEEEDEEERPKNGKTMYFIIGGILLTALAAGGIFFFLNKDKEKDKNKGENEDEQESYVTEYSVSHEFADEGTYIVYANTEDGWMMADTCYGISAEIIDQHDYDDDGHLDALILVNGGGNAHAPYPSVIYYDEEAERFKQTEEFGMPDPVVKQIGGQWTFIQYTGIRETHFAFENGEVKVVSEDVQPIGQADKKFTLSIAYYESEEGDKVIRYDLDDDGIDDRLTVHRGFSHAENFGQTVTLTEIEWNNGKKLKDVTTIYGNPVFNYSIWGTEIVFLKSKTNGMHDILTDNTHYHRWDGSTYVEWTWNGTELVSAGTDNRLQQASADGDYSYTGKVNNQWEFDMQLHIEGETVSGKYIVHGSDNGYVTLRGKVNREGDIRMDEYYDDGTPTGYYFKGTFYKTSISGDYRSTQRRIDMRFYAN